jgi:hypothetical protein
VGEHGNLIRNRAPHGLPGNGTGPGSEALERAAFTRTRGHIGYPRVPREKSPGRADLVPARPRERCTERRALARAEASRGGAACRPRSAGRATPRVFPCRILEKNLDCEKRRFEPLVERNLRRCGALKHVDFCLRIGAAQRTARTTERDGAKTPGKTPAGRRRDARGGVSLTVAGGADSSPCGRGAG